MNSRQKKINKRGVSGVDISVAIVAVAIGVSIMVSLLSVISQTTNKVNREIEATLLAKAIYEKIKIMPFAEYIEALEIPITEEGENHFGISIPKGYTIEMNILEETPTSTSEAILFSTRKQGVIRIIYMISKKPHVITMPYFKYFDRVDAINKPDLNSQSIESPNTYLSNTYFEFINHNNEPISESDVEDWKNNIPNYKLISETPLAGRMNDEGEYDIFKWVPRHIVNSSGETLYLVGKSMYYLEEQIKPVEYPENTKHEVIMTLLKKVDGVVDSGDEEGTWSYIETVD